MVLIVSYPFPVKFLDNSDDATVIINSEAMVFISTPDAVTD